MFIRSMLFVLVLAMTTNLVAAHGDQQHVTGTIEKINVDSLIVKTSEGKSLEVKLTASTVYVKRGAQVAKFSDLAPGDRVVIHATAHGDALQANTVRFAKPGDTAASSSQKTGVRP